MHIMKFVLDEIDIENALREYCENRLDIQGVARSI